MLVLWVVAALVIALGNKVLHYVPVGPGRRVAGVILLGFATVSAATAIRG